MATGQVTTRTIRPESPLFDEVKALWRAHSQTLGFLPDGAFRDHANQNHLIVATDEHGSLQGYLLYRLGKRAATIIHLCISPTARRQGCARRLMTVLRASVETIHHIVRIELRCRRDYGINDFWARLGFVARREQCGRGKDASEITEWHLPLERRSLFDEVTESETRLRVAIDTNIFLDLEDGVDADARESEGLTADWIAPYIRLAITPELHNDLERQDESEKRQKAKRLAKTYEELSAPQTRLEEFITELKTHHFQGTLVPSDESDLRHLAWSIAAGVDAFVTRDDPLLRRSEKIREAYGLEILRPSDLIGRMDTLARTAEYQQRFVAGANSLTRHRLQKYETQLRSNFCNFQGAESKGDFRQSIQFVIANPREFESHVVRERSGDDVALEVIDWQNDKSVKLPMFRIRPSRFAGSLACTLLGNLIQQSAKEKRFGIMVTDKFISDTVAMAFTQMGFVTAEDTYVKFTPRGLFTAQGLGDWVETAANEMGLSGSNIANLIEVLRGNEIRESPEFACQIEHLLWPAKLTDCRIETYLVPIRPAWASHLFEETLANQTLFGAEEHLAINPEAVYYRAARPSVCDFGRILWYVSSKGNYSGQMSLRACSRIKNVTVDVPKSLYRQFRRLGIYEWQNLMDTAKNDHAASIMAIHFDDTELLANPVKWNDLKVMLERHGVRGNIQSARKIPNEAFIEIYEHCTRVE